MNEKKSIREKVGYSLGDVAANLMFQILALLLMKLVADHFGLQTAIYVALAYVALLTFCHLSITPYFSKSRPVDTRQEMLTSLRSQPWRAVALTMTVVTLAQSLRCATFGFYLYDYVDCQSLAAWLDGWTTVSATREEACAAGLFIFIAAAVVSQLAGIVLSTRFFQRYGKKEMFVACLALTALLSLTLYVPQPDDITLTLVLCVLKSLAFAPAVPLLWAMTSDVADHVEHQHHRRTTGSCYAGVTFALKAGLGLGLFLAGLLLLVFGYASDPSVLQSWTAVQGIRFASSVIPALLFVVGIMTLWSYPITKSYGERIQAELTERRKIECITY